MRPHLPLLLTLTLAACAAPTPLPPAQIDPPFPPPVSTVLGAEPRTYAVETGWYNGQAVKYYNLGMNTPVNSADPSRVLTAQAWVFATGANPDGSPIKLEGQDTLFDFAPGDLAYSDLWQIFFVTPDAAYAPNHIKSHADLPASGLAIEKKPMLVNCPIVPTDSRLADDALPLIKSWVNGQAFDYFDFGPTSPVPGKVYAFVTGFDAQGQPQLVAGQHFIFAATRGTPNYSDFWAVQWVTVAAAYQADSLRTVADIPAAQITPSGLVVNYPHKVVDK